MTKDELYAMIVDNYYNDIEEFTGAFKRGDITEEHYCELVTYARDFWLSVNK